jgi:RNA polymerase-binding protein DksA
MQNGTGIKVARTRLDADQQPPPPPAHDGHSRFTPVPAMSAHPDTDALRQRIEARLEALRREIDVKLGDAVDVTQALEHVGDNGDQSVVDDAATTDFADARRDLDEYHAGRAALKRLDAGTYGTCEACGEDIPRERLAASPFAARCIACQTRAEHASGMRPTSM